MLLRAAAATDADAVTTVFLASRAAALPWLPQLHTDVETRSWVEPVVLAQQRTWLAVDGDRPGRSRRDLAGCRRAEDP